MSVMMLGVRVDQVTKPEALARAREFLFGTEQKTIVTPNPEMLVKAYTDDAFRDVLNRADLNVCDGFGIRLASKLTIERIPGVDLLSDLCALAENENKSVFFMGSGNESVVAAVAEAMQERFPRLIVAGVHRGPDVRETPDGIVVDEAENRGVIDYLNRTQPDLLFVAFGMGKQEKWLHQYLRQVASVRVAVGVGGAFDFIAGRVSRAPLLMRKIGLEWLYRLARQPWRIGRIWNALVVFPYLILHYGKSR